jgi:ABC-type bacteriocin/lantibiotic exporter with double-glycine peptidase domain
MNSIDAAKSENVNLSTTLQATSKSSQLRQWILFLGPGVIRLLGGGIIAGLGVFAVELVIAYGLQAFLLGLGLMNSDVVRLPWWIPQTDLKEILVFIFILSAVRSLLYFFQVYIPNATYNAFGFRQRKRLIEWAFSSVSVNTPFVTTLYTERTTFASSFLNGAQYMVIYGSTSILIALALFWLAPLLALTAFVLMGIFLGPIYLLNKQIRAASIHFAESWEVTNNRLLVGLRNIFLIRTYGMQNDEVTKASASLDLYSRSHLRIYKLGAVKFALPQVVGICIICLTVYLGKTQMGIESATLITFLYLFFRWVQNLSFLYLNAAQVIHYRPQIDGLFAWHQAHYLTSLKSIQSAPSRSHLLEAKPLEHALGWEAKGLSFSYDQKTQVFENLDFKINPGSRVLISGASGSGKTTLIGLLLGQLQGPGALLFQDGGTLRTLDEIKNSLVQSIGYAGPEPFIIDGTVSENLMYALSEKPSAEKIKRALQIAACEFIYEMPMGLETALSEQGHGLSTGQKQRISLARALLREPKALFLDEALSNLDNENRLKVLGNLLEQRNPFTLILISHSEFAGFKPDLEIFFRAPGKVEIK